jgi:hypothetical protein
MTSMTLTRSPRLSAGVVAAIAAGVSFVVYARTLLPGIAFGDWGEMQTVPHVVGVAHPTGYPTYVLLGWLAQLVPVGSVAFRANLLSGVLVAGSLAVTVLLLVRLRVAPLVALAAVLALGAVRTVWAAATVAEVNPLHLLLVAVLLRRVLVWQDEGQPRDLVAIALVLGLAVGNHLLTLFTAPWIVAAVLWSGRRAIVAKPRSLLGALIAGLAGLGVYLYIPLAAGADPPLPYNHPTTWDRLWQLVSGRQFRDQFDFLASSGPATFAGSLGDLWSLLASRGTPILPILGLCGLAILVRRRPAFGLACLGILGTHCYIWANYLHLEHYLLVPWLVLAVGAGVALDAGARFVGKRLPVRWVHEDGPAIAGSAVAAAGLILAVGLGALNWSASDRSGDHGGDAYVDALLGALPEDAAILTVWDASTPLWHARYVLGQRPDVLIVDDTNIVYDGWGSRERRAATLVCERPVFILRLNDRDLEPTRAAFRLEPFLTVRIGQGGPQAVVDREVYRVLPLDAAACPS